MCIDRREDLFGITFFVKIACLVIHTVASTNTNRVCKKMPRGGLMAKHQLISTLFILKLVLLGVNALKDHLDGANLLLASHDD